MGKLEKAFAKAMEQNEYEELVDDKFFLDILVDSKSLRLAILNICDDAMIDRSDETAKEFSNRVDGYVLKLSEVIKGNTFLGTIDGKIVHPVWALYPKLKE